MNYYDTEDKEVMNKLYKYTILMDNKLEFKCPVCGEPLNVHPLMKKHLFIGWKPIDTLVKKECSMCKSIFDVFFKYVKKSYSTPIFLNIQHSKALIELEELKKKLSDNSISKEYDLYVFKVKDYSTILFGKRNKDIETELLSSFNSFYIERGDGTKYRYGEDEIEWAIRIATIRPLKSEKII
jgi:hypothetical protein